MKHLVGKPITMSITTYGLMYTIVADDHTVEILNSPDDKDFEMCIYPTGVHNIIEIEPINYNTLIEALNDADEIIGELLVEDEI